MDWYELAHGQSLKGKLVASALVNANGTYTLQVATDDAQRLFPQNCRLLEIIGYTGVDAQADLAGMIYDAASNTLTPVVVVAPVVVTAKADIWRRVTDQEADTIIAVLAQQSPRKQRLFADAMHLDHADENFAELYAGFVQAFGKERADTILAHSPGYRS